MDVSVNRRNLLLGLGAGSATAVLAGCGGSSSGATAAEDPSMPGRARDAMLLNEALRFELEEISAYTQAARVLPDDLAEIATTFAEQEREHAERLAAAVRAAGGRPVELEERVDLAMLRSPEDFLRFALDKETEAVALYTETLPQFSDPRLRAAASSILTNEAEHAATLRLELGQPAAPEALSEGAE